MEEDLKILKVEYLGNQWSDFPQILNLSLKGRQQSVEEDLKILKVEYLSIHWSDFPQIVNLSLRDQTLTIT